MLNFFQTIKILENELILSTIFNLLTLYLEFFYLKSSVRLEMGKYHVFEIN